MKSDVAKYINIYRRIPYHVSKGAQKNYNFYLREAEKEFKKKKPNRVVWEDIIANALLFKTTDRLFGRKNQNPIGDTNIKSHTVAYTLSLLHELTDGMLNLNDIWNNQEVDELLSIELKKGLIYVYSFFTSLNVLLISESAKSEKTWNELLGRKKNPFDMDIIKSYCFSKSDYYKRYEEKQEDISEEVDKYSRLQRIVELGVKFWDGLNYYIFEVDLFSKYQQNTISNIRGKIKRNSNFSENEILQGNKILDILIKNKIEFSEVKKLSKLEDKNEINPSLIYNKLSQLNKSDWEKIIALGDQGKLTLLALKF